VTIGHRQAWEGGDILMDEGFADGRLVLLSMSLHAYDIDGYGGLDCINSKEWSPCEIIGAWHAPGELDEPYVKPTNEGVMTLTGNYEGNKSLLAIAKLREKAPVKKTWLTKSTTQVPDSPPPTNFKLPTGDIGFKK